MLRLEPRNARNPLGARLQCPRMKRHSRAGSRPHLRLSCFRTWARCLRSHSAPPSEVESARSGGVCRPTQGSGRIRRRGFPDRILRVHLSNSSETTRTSWRGHDGFCVQRHVHAAHRAVSEVGMAERVLIRVLRLPLNLERRALAEARLHHSITKGDSGVHCRSDAYTAGATTTLAKV